MSLSDISNEIETLSTESRSSQFLPKVDSICSKTRSEELNKFKKRISLESQQTNFDLINDDKLSINQENESDLENDSTEFFSDHVEIGLPKILKFTNKISLITSRLSLEPSIENDEVVCQTKNFFRLTLNEYLNGGIICQFCQKSTFNWNSPNKCCMDFRVYVESIIEHNRFQEALRKDYKIDNFRSADYLEEIRQKKLLIQEGLSQIKKFEANFVKSNFKTKFDKPVKYNKVFKKQSFKPKESFAILTINKRYSSIGEKNKKKEISERSSNLEERLSNIISSKSFEEKIKDKISYSLSNREFIDQGWTVLYKNAFKNIEKEPELESKRKENYSVFDLAENIPTQFSQTSSKFYLNGNLFELMLSDKTGTIYYPNGNIAIVISLFGDFKTFLAFTDEDKNSILLAYFDSNGNIFCNHSNGKLRYQLNNYGGINFDQNGSCLKKWLWPKNSKKNTFRPIISKLNEFMSIKMFNRDKIVFNFRSKQSNCKFVLSTVRNDNSDGDQIKYEHFKNTISDPECKKLKEKADLLVNILTNGFTKNMDEENVKNILNIQEDTFYVKLPQIKNSKPSSIVSRISLNHSSLISTERDKISQSSESKKYLINITDRSIK